MDDKASENDVISLEQLVNDELKNPSPGNTAGNTAGNTPGNNVPSTEATAKVTSTALASDKSPDGTTTPAEHASSIGSGGLTDDFDSALLAADPDFAKSLKELAEMGDGNAELDLDVDSILARERAEAGHRGFKWLIVVIVKRPVRFGRARLTSLKLLIGQGFTLLVAGLKQSKSASVKLLVAIRSGIVAGFKAIANALKWFHALKFAAKAQVVSIPVILGVLVVITRSTLSGHLFPSTDAGILRSFSDIADARYTFEESEGWEDLNNPLLHPEHVVLIERIIANLRNPGDGSNPMALIEAYIETSSKEAALEITDREIEFRDLISRTIEKVSYDDLSTVQGKNKLKIMLRKTLNELMTKGKIRRLYYKSIILKP